tara:strand:- start:281 stop:1552 length:1272 start_codon:yes stop_codon:yes gene_type:complete
MTRSRDFAKGATRSEFDYTATAGQTTFTGNDNDSESLAYTAGQIDVYLNGSHLNVTDDYVATNGTSVVLQSGAQAGDSLVIVAYGSFNVANVVATRDLEGNEFILDDDGDTSITADTDDQIDIKIANTDHLILKGSSGDVVFQTATDAKDIKFNQYDGRTVLDINDAGYVGIANGATGSGELRIYEDTDNGTNYTGFKVGTQSGDIDYTLPTADGSNGQFLKTNGSGVLSFGTAGGGGLEVISAVNVYDATATTTSYSFTGFDSDYDNYYVVIHGIAIQADGDIQMRFLDDGSAITASNYRQTTLGLTHTNSEKRITTDADDKFTIVQQMKAGLVDPTNGWMYFNNGAGGRWDSDSNDSQGVVSPSFVYMTGGEGSNGSSRIAIGHGYINEGATNACNGFQLIFPAGTGAQKINLTVYGVKRA